MHIGVTVFNFEDGGLLPGGGYDFAPGIRAIAADPVYTDVVVLLEANQYGHDGETPLNRFVNALSEAARVPLVGRLGELDRGHFAPALIWNPNSVIVEKWFGYGVHRVAQQRMNYCEARVRDGKPFGVLLQHWDDQCGGLRFTSAQRISWVAKGKDPSVGCGRFQQHCVRSAREPERDFSKTPIRATRVVLVSPKLSHTEWAAITLWFFEPGGCHRRRYPCRNVERQSLRRRCWPHWLPRAPAPSATLERTTPRMTLWDRMPCGWACSAS